MIIRKRGARFAEWDSVSCFNIINLKNAKSSVHSTNTNA